MRSGKKAQMMTMTRTKRKWHSVPCIYIHENATIVNYSDSSSLLHQFARASWWDMDFSERFGRGDEDLWRYGALSENTRCDSFVLPDVNLTPEPTDILFQTRILE